MMEPIMVDITELVIVLGFATLIGIGLAVGWCVLIAIGDIADRWRD